MILKSKTSKLCIDLSDFGDYLKDYEHRYVYRYGLDFIYYDFVIDSFVTSYVKSNFPTMFKRALNTLNETYTIRHKS